MTTHRNRRARNAARAKKQSQTKQVVKETQGLQDEIPETVAWSGEYLRWLAPYLDCAEQLMDEAGGAGTVVVALQLVIVDELKKLRQPAVYEQNEQLLLS